MSSAQKANNQIVDSLKSAVRFLRDPKVRLTLALITLAFSIFLALAFISYLWTWDIDQSKLRLSASEYFDPETLEVENWAGHQGAWLANLFIHEWFGITSFALVFVLFILSFRIIKLRLLPMGKSLKYSLITIVWGSVALSYTFGDAAFYLGGKHGYVVHNWLSALLGKVGTGFILVISLFAVIIFAFESSYSWLKMQLSKYTNKSEYEKLKAEFDKKKKQVKPKTKVKEEPEPIEEVEPSFADIQTGEEIPEKEAELEPKETVDKNEFLLHDDGKKEIIEETPKEDLGFEVDVTVKEEIIIEEPSTNSTQDDDDNQEPEETTKIEHIDLGDGQLLEVKQPQEEKTNAEITEEAIQKLEDNVTLRVEKNQDVLAEQITNEMGDYDPTLDLPNFEFPPIDILVDHKIPNSEVTNEELLENKNNIVETLRNFKIEIEKIKAVVGPTVTLYEIIPAPGVRISKIKNLEDDIALSLSALGIRIIAPMPGRGTIGIEVPNQKPKIVSMRAVVASEKFQQNKFELPVALGKNISNETFVADLAKMPHLLVAGATGQGKSVGINVILSSLLYKKHPSQLKFVLVDPKKVELTLYDHIKNHYLAQLPDAAEPIITDNQIVVNTLNSLNVEMDDRYQLLKDAQVRNIKEYNAKFVSRKLNPQKGHRYLPYIVLVIDEFADLIMTAGKEVELPIARLAQLARAIGIHLIVATQRPSTNIITGVIKANFPTRLAFKVASMIDSRTILDASGANQLIGRGDMLITQGSELVRLQCAFIDTPEVEALTDFIAKQRGYPEPHILPEVPTEGDDEATSVDLAKKDELFEDAARIVVIHQQGSTSLIQRKLSIGYNRAGRIIDQLEAAGIVGPFEGSKARQVHYQDEYALEQYLDQLKEQFG